MAPAAASSPLALPPLAFPALASAVHANTAAIHAVRRFVYVCTHNEYRPENTLDVIDQPNTSQRNSAEELVRAVGNACVLVMTGDGLR